MHINTNIENLQIIAILIVHCALRSTSIMAWWILHTLQLSF